MKFVIIFLVLFYFSSSVAGKHLPPPAIRLFEVTPDGSASKLLTGDPDSEISLELGKEYRLECTAGYPVQWVYLGNGAPVMDTSIMRLSAKEYKATALIPVVTEYHTGKYKCLSAEKPAVMSYFYIYAPGPAVFNNLYDEKAMEMETNTVLIPCTATSPFINITMTKMSGIPLDREATYYPRRGFQFRVHDLTQAEGTYQCRGSYVGNRRTIEYHVGRPERTEHVHSPRPARKTRATGSAPAEGSGLHRGGGNSSNPVCFPSCAKNAQCVVSRGAAVCRCAEPFKGDGYLFCETPGDECNEHDDCPDHLSCFVDSTCRDPCNDTVYGAECGGNGAVCTTVNHELVCACPIGTYGDPLRGCFPITPGQQSLSLASRPVMSTGSCKAHTDCDENLSCFADGFCRDPCADTIHRFVCGKDAVCRTVAHRPVCSCPGGFYGDPYKVCISRTPRTPPQQIDFADAAQIIAPML